MHKSNKIFRIKKLRFDNGIFWCIICSYKERGCSREGIPSFFTIQLCKRLWMEKNEGGYIYEETGNDYQAGKTGGSESDSG